MADNSPTERFAALKILLAVYQGKSLTECLSGFNFDHLNTALVKEMCFGVLRFFEQLESILNQLLQKPFKEKDDDVKLWLMLGLYQLKFMHMPEYAVVSEMVEQGQKLKKPWAKGLINAVLRNYLRQAQKLSAKAENVANLPGWILKKIKAAWPNHVQQILPAMQTQAPLFLRVNVRKSSREDYLAKLVEAGIAAEPSKLSAVGIKLLKALPVEQIPGFADGLVSVQDIAAQVAANLLDLKADLTVLDACAAPGGKTAHILEAADVDLLALDISAKRCTLIQENLQRLRLTAEIQVIDAKKVSLKQFDRILLDAPCSATGVIRRHPDIKLHRKEEDIAKLAAEQAALLEALWLQLKPGGRLVYATCSIFPEENEQQMSKFIANHSDANVVNFELSEGVKQKMGWQLLPTVDGCDGFYYCVITKEV